MSKIRLQFEISKDLDAEIEELAKQENTSKSEILRRGLSVMRAFREQSKRGRKHLGFVEDPLKLDAEMLGIITSRFASGDSKPDGSR
jgi:Ribbon-helix-helix protein, copG family